MPKTGEARAVEGEIRSSTLLQSYAFCFLSVLQPPVANGQDALGGVVVALGLPQLAPYRFISHRCSASQLDTALSRNLPLHLVVLAEISGLEPRHS